MTAPLTDLEITRACAMAMGFVATYDEALPLIVDEGMHAYHPLTNDAQAMALIRKFRLYIDGMLLPDWTVAATGGYSACNTDLNRAVCLTVAAMTAPKD